MKILKTVFIVQIIIILAYFLFFNGKGCSASHSFNGDFEKGTAGWFVLDRTVAQISSEKEAKSVHDGAGSLRFDYHHQEGKIPVCGTGKLNLEGRKAIAFWVKCDLPAILTVVAGEKDGSNYVFPVSVGESNTWKEVRLNFSQMRPGENSKDENSRLDLADVSLGFVDFLLLLSKDDKKRTVWIDSLTLLDNEFPIDKVALPSTMSFETDMDGWVGFTPGYASVCLTHDPENIREGRGALQCEYSIEADRIAGLALVGIDFRDRNRISFFIKTNESSELVLAVEERDKSRYIHKFETEGKTWKKVEITFDDFVLADDSQDENNELDRDQLNGFLVIIDTDSFLPVKVGPQRLWLDEFTLQ